MRKILEKRVLPVLAALCLLVTMVAVAMSFASAATPGKIEDGVYTPKTINFKIGSFELANGEAISYDTTLFFTGDTLKNDQGGWWKDYNGRWTYNGTDVQYTSGNIYWLNIKNTTTNANSRVAVGRGELGNVTLAAGNYEIICELENAVQNGSNVGTRTLVISRFTVTDADPINFPAEKPVIESYTNKSITVTPVEGHEYSIDGTTWQSSNVFANLTPNTKYTVYQRVAATGEKPAGVKSEGVSITLPRINHGTEDPSANYSSRTIKISTRGGNTENYVTTDAKPSNLVNFETSTVKIDGQEFASIFVGDKLQNTHWWRDVRFSSPTGSDVQINDVYLKSEGVDHKMQVGYGHGDYEFTKPGEYRIVTNIGGTEYELARFQVFWPTQDIIDQLVEISRNGGPFYYQKQKVNLVVNDTTGKFCDYVGTDVMEIHVSDSIYIETLWTNYLFEYRKGDKTYQGTVEDIYIYGVKGAASGYNGYVPSSFGQDDMYVEVETGYGEGFDVNKPENLEKPIVTLEKTGTYAVYGNVKTGSTVTSVYLGTFVVTATPTENKLNEKFTNSKGKYDNIDDHLYAYQPREIKYYVDTPSSYLGQYLSFSEDCNNVFYVTDKLVNGGYWSNNTFDYTDVYGKVHTGKIFNAKYILVTESGNKEMGWAQAGYGNSNAYSSEPFELTEPGLWMIIGQQIEDDTNGRINNIVMATFTVLPLESDDPRGTGDQFTAVSKALRWNGSFNKDDFRNANPDDANDAGTSYIDANGYLYVQHDPATQTKTSATIRTIAPLRLGTLFNVAATYAKNVEVGSTTDDKFSVKIGGNISNSLEFVVEYNNGLGIYQGKLSYQGAVIGEIDFTDDYNSAIGTYNIENKFGKITVYRNDKALAFVSTATGKEVTTFDISKDYYFNVANVTIGVSGQGSYIPYLNIKPVDPTVINLDKTISFEKFDTENFKGNTGSLKDGALHATGRDMPTITTTAPYNLGNSFSVATGFWRTNGFTNYYGEKYAMAIGDITLKVGNDKNGESKCVAELYYQDVLLGTVDRGNAGGYSISGKWTVSFENGIISVTCNESKDGTLTQCKFVSAATGEEVTAFQVDDWDFESTHISLTAAGNYGPDGSCSVSTLVMSPGSGGVSGVSTGGSSGSASTGDASTSLFIILAVLVAAGTVLVTVRKVAVA